MKVLDAFYNKSALKFNSFAEDGNIKCTLYANFKKFLNDDDLN